MAWQTYRQLTINGTSSPRYVGTSNQSSFPVLVSFAATTSWLETSSGTTSTGIASTASCVTGNGVTYPADIAFYSAVPAPGTTTGNLLPFEIASYTPSTGVIEAWVQVSTLFGSSGGSDTIIYLAYNNPGLSTDYSGFGTGTKPWDTNYKGVWHLPDGTTLAAKDSTSNANNGTITSATAGAGQIDGAATFSSANIDAGNGSSLQITGQLTLEGWVKSNNLTAGTGNWVISKSDDSTQRSYAMYVNASGMAAAIYQEPSPTHYYAFDHAIPDTNWHHWAVAFDQVTVTNTVFYLDGNSVSKNNVSNNWTGSAIANGTSNVRLGNKSGTSAGLSGSLDEARISSTMRSADWIKAEYSNQTNVWGSVSGQTLGSATTVYAADGTGTLTTGTSTVLAGSTGNTITFTYTANASNGTNAGAVTIVVPSGWTAPQVSSSGSAGYVTASSTGTIGSPSVASQTITIPTVTLAATQTITIVYGSGGGAAGGTATTSTGAQTWQVQEKSTSGGTLTNIGASPSITVNNAADGSGTLTTGTSSVPAYSINNTITFTYTAATGGTTTGAVTLVVPSGWSAPSTTGSDNGYATATSTGSIGTLSVASQTITIPSVTLTAGQTITITYGSTASGGPGAKATSAQGAQTWQVQEKSTSGGTLTNIGASPSITVGTPNPGSGTGDSGWNAGRHFSVGDGLSRSEWAN